MLCVLAAAQKKREDAREIQKKQQNSLIGKAMQSNNSKDKANGNNSKRKPSRMYDASAVMMEGGSVAQYYQEAEHLQSVSENVCYILIDLLQLDIGYISSNFWFYTYIGWWSCTNINFPNKCANGC